MCECVMCIAKLGDKLWSLSVRAGGSSGSVLLRWEDQPDRTLLCSHTQILALSRKLMGGEGPGYQNRLCVASWTPCSVLSPSHRLSSHWPKEGVLHPSPVRRTFPPVLAWCSQSCAQDSGPVSLASLLWGVAVGDLRGTLQSSGFSTASSFAPVLNVHSFTAT